MKILISIFVTIGYTSAIIGAVFLIKLFIKKATYYPSNRQEEVSYKTSELSYISGVLMTLSTICFFGSKEIIKYDFKKTLKENKISSVELNDIFFSQNDIKDIFNNFESTEGRFRCESFNGFINFENSSIPIEVIRHCYEKDRYIIIYKKYYIDATIGDIRTTKFDYLKKDSIKLK